jgi:hypothetical protein
MYESARSLDFFPVRAGKPAADLSFGELKCYLHIHLMAFHIIHGKGKRKRRKEKKEKKRGEKGDRKKGTRSYAPRTFPLPEEGQTKD